MQVRILPFPITIKEEIKMDWGGLIGMLIIAIVFYLIGKNKGEAKKDEES